MGIGRMSALACAALLAACSGTSTGMPGSAQATATGAGATAAPTAAGNTPEPTTEESAIVQEIDFGEPVWNVVAAGDTVWVEAGTQEDPRLVQLDAASGRQLQEIDGGSWPTIAGESLWYMKGEHLIEADATTGVTRASFETGHVGSVVSDGVQWAADWDSHLLTAFDLGKGKALHTAPLPAGEPKAVQPWEGAVWVFIDGSGGVGVRIDSDTGEVIGDVDAGSRPHSVALGFGSLWVTDHGTANLFRFAPDGAPEAQIPGPGLNVAIAVTDDAVWAAGPTGLFRIDPASNQIAAKLRLGPGDWYGMAHAADFLWVSSGESNRVLQVDPPD